MQCLIKISNTEQHINVPLGDSNMIYVRENSSLIYNITLTNTGLCSVYHPVTSFTSTYLSLTRVFNGEVILQQ